MIPRWKKGNRYVFAPNATEAARIFHTDERRRQGAGVPGLLERSGSYDRKRNIMVDETEIATLQDKWDDAPRVLTNARSKPTVDPSLNGAAK